MSARKDPAETVPLISRWDWRQGGDASVNMSGEQALPPPAVVPKKRVNSKERLVSLDAVRGLTVAVMIFVDDAGGWLGGIINHSPWNDVTFADFGKPTLTCASLKLERESLVVWFVLSDEWQFLLERMLSRIH